jgi:sulfur-carrier protein adenylyltransferase/sulfurtransferase
MKEISVSELKKRIDSNDPIQVIDIRESNEYEYCNIGAQHIPMGEIMMNLDKISRDKDVIIHCKSGGRSSAMVQALEVRGYNNVINLTGGILAWSTEIDPTVPKY